MRSVLATRIGVILATASSCCALTGAQSAAPKAARGGLHRVWSVDQPLFEELLTDQRIGHAVDGALAWRHDEGHVEFGLQYGVVRTREDDLERWRRHRLHPITGASLSDEYLAPFRQRGVTLTYYPYQYLKGPVADGVPVDETGYAFILDPRTTERYLGRLRPDLRKYGADLFAVQLLDEGLEKMTRQVLYFHGKYGGSGEYPFIDQCADEIKREFGFGKYGIHVEEASAPFSRIALRRWVIQKSIDRARRIREAVKQEAPHLLLVSHDPVSSICPMHLCRWGEICDLMVNQVADSRPTRGLCRFGFITKFVVDLSGKEFWPCAHVHDLPVKAPPNYSADEARELVSQLLRNGARGLVVYAPDHPGLRGDRKYCFYSDYLGAPNRWRVVVETADILRRMNRLRFPQPDVAVLYSNDSNMTVMPDHRWGSSWDDAYLYMILGPQLGCWFRFVSDEQIDRGKADLRDFKVVFIAFSPYQRMTTVKALTEYLSAGGTIVCGDPLVWTSLDDGETADAFRRDVFGVSVRADNVFQPAQLKCLDPNPVFGADAGPLRVVRNDAYQITPTSHASVIARFEDGQPAVVMNNVGKGRAVYFALAPFKAAIANDKSWIALFGRMCERSGVRLNQDI